MKRLLVITGQRSNANNRYRERLLMIRLVTFWGVQIINTLTALGRLIAPETFHEGMFENPQAAYGILGFSDTAVAMLHNVLRGQGAVLLAVSVFLFVLGRQERRSYLLIALVCGLSLIAHAATLQQHLASSVVKQAISSFGALYAMMALNALLTAGGLWGYCKK